MSSRKSPQSRKRCPKGTRKCWSTKKCVQKLKSNGKRCRKGTRKCANNVCYTRRPRTPSPSPNRPSPRRTRSGKIRGGKQPRMGGEGTMKQFFGNPFQ